MAKNLTLTKSLSLYKRGVELVPGGTHTSSKRAPQFALGAYPAYVESGSGCRVKDVDGNEYIDYVMGLGPITLGYTYKAVDDAIRKQLAKGIIFGQPHSVEIEAAEAIRQAVPSAEMVRFFKTGAEATSAATRLARAYTKRELILSHGYHGWHDQWTALRNDGGVPKALERTVKSFAFNDLKSLKKLLKKHPQKVAAIVMEPAGSVAPEEGYLECVRELAHKHGALLVFDEIVTGFRLAPGGGQEFFGVEADLVCYAKGIANGMPLAAVVGRKAIMEVMEHLVISSTYGGETLSLAAVIASLSEYRKRPVHKHIWAMGQMLMDGLNECYQKHGIEAKCCGLAPMSAVRLDYRDAKLSGMIWTYILQEAASRGVLFRRGGLNFITYSHKKADIERTLEVSDEVMAALSRCLKKDTLESNIRAKSPEFVLRQF